MLTLYTDTFTVYRFPAGDYTNGFYGQGASSSFSLTGSVQPDNSNKENLKDNPNFQGTDISGMIKIFTDTELYTKENSPTKQADLILYKNRWLNFIK